MTGDDLLVGAARLSLEPPARPAARRLRPPDPRRDGVRQVRARDLGHRAGEGRPAGRALRRRHRRHRGAGDHRPARPDRRRHRRRPGRDPAQLEPHASLRRRGRLGRRVRRPARARARCADQARSPTSCRTRSCRSADSRSSRLEPARPVWGVGYAELAVNRRERTADGTTILGWNPDDLVDNQVTSLQFRRPDESVVATAVNYGCHPVTTGYDMYVYSADFPGPLRDVVRRVTGGEAVFLQGAGGNVLPEGRVHRRRERGRADGRPARDRGAALARGALRAPAADGLPAGAVDHADLVVPTRGRRDRPRRARRHDAARAVPAPAAAEPRGRPCRLAPSGRRSSRTRSPPAAATEAPPGSRSGTRAGRARRSGRWSHGTAPTFREGRIHAIRIGDGVIVTGPGEVFTEIGMAVKERSPGTPTMYAGFTNGLIAYFATAAEYAHGGYEADYSCRGHGNPSHVAPECERILVETGVRAAESLFPDAVALGRRAQGGQRLATCPARCRRIRSSIPTACRRSERVDQLEARLDRAPGGVRVQDHGHRPTPAGSGRAPRSSRRSSSRRPGSPRHGAGSRSSRSCSRARTCPGAANGRGSRGPSRRRPPCSSR